MLKAMLKKIHQIINFMLLAGVGIWLPVASQAQLPGTVGGFGAGGDEGADSENSRFPIKMNLEGVLNPTLASDKNLALLQLSVRDFQDYYQFAVRRAEVPELPQKSPTEILHSLDKYKVQMKVVGDKALRSKIGQALPGTPIKIVGFFTRKHREFRVVEVEVLSTGGLFESSQ